ncbi:armadillo-type protein [Schizophyllum amplum]|uniref:Armadillo-type protein n=1 Tax=Schizophyllum amplum TaxID=97359 RepID=A0A550CMR2_9AGAR|nr:armadillo-type protein [Auriculariopsis ampla]
MVADPQTQALFQRLKRVCVPLMGTPTLVPSTTPTVSNLLSQLIHILEDSRQDVLSPNLISYIFFPLSSLLSRNRSEAIPDQVLEKIFLVLTLLSEDWWWDCELKIWEQLFMLAGAILGGIDAKGKAKARDEETKEAAVRCILSLVRPRNQQDAERRGQSTEDASERLEELRFYAQTPKFIPILGQTINSLLETVLSPNISLTLACLQTLHALIDAYIPDDLAPSILPGVISTMTKLALGISGKKGWVNGDVVAASLTVFETIVVRTVGDDICAQEGATKVVESLDDLKNLASDGVEQARTTRPFATQRTPSWLRGTATQLHIALNSLTPLISHPSASALLALTKCATALLNSTSSTLPQSQSLLLTLLLALSNSDYPSVSQAAQTSLISAVASKPRTQHIILQTLMSITRDNLTSLPRLLTSQSDSKVEHVAGLVEAVCRLSYCDSTDDRPALHAISVGVGKLLGPSGGIEKWGWSLLSVLEFIEPTVNVAHEPTAALLEDIPEAAGWWSFPEVPLKSLTTRSAADGVTRMFRALGRASADCVSTPLSGSRAWGNPDGAATQWRLSAEAAKDVRLRPTSKRLSKLARSLATTVSEVWDDGDEQPGESESSQRPEAMEPHSSVQHVQGLHPLHDTLKIIGSAPAQQYRSTVQPILHRALLLQLLAVLAGVLQAKFSQTLIRTLYPILHSLVSPVPLLSATAHASLVFVTISASYASPANLLLANFDYALDAVSRRLTRRWLDLDATKVLVILVRLVGSDVVDRAGDVVEECFDRLDEFHGYDALVEGLIQVLGEVIKVIEVEDMMAKGDRRKPPKADVLVDREHLATFFECACRRDDAPPTPIQTLTKQIVARSLYFLTHGAPSIRARILTLLASAVPVIPESALMPEIHRAWPFILNRLSDRETFVVAAAAGLVEALATHVGDFMFRRVWDDVWPRFHAMLAQLDRADAQNALARRTRGVPIGTESSYTHSHRLYRSLLRTMTAAARGVQPQDASLWEVIVDFRRFLHIGAHDELQRCARDLYLAIGLHNADEVWLALAGTIGEVASTVAFLREPRWDIRANAALICQSLDDGEGGA